MTDVISAVADSSSPTEPSRVTYVGTMLAAFRYRTVMPLGKVLENKKSLQLKLVDNRCFKFLLKKTTPRTVSVICERHVKDETLEPGSTVEGDSLEADNGCFLRLYISVIGVNEKPKRTVLRSTDTSASVEFMEASFLNPLVNMKNIYILKCLVRRIETNSLSNTFAREQELLWEKCMVKACMSDNQKKDMAYILKRQKPIKVLTGRRTRYNLICLFVSRACSYSKELVQYFKNGKSSKSRTINLGLILGHLYDGRKTSISGYECRMLYMVSLFEGLTFIKELCTQFFVENLTDQSVVDAFEIADMTDDAQIFEAAYSYCRENKLKLKHTDKWKRLISEKDLVARSIMHGIILRRFADSQGFPPAMEEETGQP